MNNVTVGDTVSVLQFIQKYGTHYINGYITGNSLYQVTIYLRRSELVNLRAITSRFSFSTKEIISTSKKGWNHVASYRFRKTIFTLVFCSPEEKHFWRFLILSELFCAVVRWTFGHGALCKRQLDGGKMGEPEAEAQLLSVHLQQPFEASRIEFASQSPWRSTGQRSHPSTRSEVARSGIQGSWQKALVSDRLRQYDEIVGGEHGVTGYATKCPPCKTVNRLGRDF